MRRESPLQSLFINQLKALPQHDQLMVRENFLTACFAGTLLSSLSLRRRVTRIFVGKDRWKGTRISRAVIDVLIQQTETAPRRSARHHYRLDLVLVVNHHYRIAVEIKLYAAEGVDESGKRQLDHYLRLAHIDAVAYLTATVISISARAARHSHYLMPRDRHGGSTRSHFLWSDLYPVISALSFGRHAAPLVGALRGFLEWLGLRPVHPLIGELGGTVAFTEVAPNVRRNRERIQAAMGQVQRVMREARWETAEVRNNGTLYTWPSIWPSPVYRFWLSPGILPGSFRIWLELSTVKVRTALETKLAPALTASLKERFGRDLFPVVRTVRERTRRPSIDIRLPYQTLLAGLRAPEGVGHRLAAAVDAFRCTVIRIL